MSASQKELREAWKLGVRFARADDDDSVLEALARKAYPPRKLVRPRIEVVGGFRFRAFNGAVQWAPVDDPENWQGESDTVQVAFRLGQNPTETVEDDDA